MTRVHIIPSLLSADFTRLGSQVEEVVQAGATTVQIDVMDGHFVPNLSMGVPVVASLRRAVDITLDVHLMIEEPERYVDAFVDAGADVLTVHAEATRHLQGTLARIRARGVLCGAALNPATPIAALEEVLCELDLVLVMTINPGFGGQTLIPSTLDKVARLHSTIRARGLDVPIQVDGGINTRTAGAAAAAGATQLVAGSAVFGAATTVAEAFRALDREANAVTDP